MKIKVAVIQFQISINTPNQNIEKGLNFLKDALKNNAKLVVLPEIWSTGLYPEILTSSFLSQTNNIIEEICKLAKENNAIIVSGSLPYLSNNKIYNRLHIINDEGEIAGTYDKIQLFKANNEHYYSHSGNKVIVVKTKDFYISPFICFDLRFPELFRIASFNQAQILTISAQFPLSRINHWISLIKARAIENQCYVLASNICKNDGLLELGGNSMIVSPNGDILAQCGLDEEIQYSEIDMVELENYRKKFNFLNEAILKDNLKNYINYNLPPKINFE